MVIAGAVLWIWSSLSDLPLFGESELRWAALASVMLMSGALGRPIAGLPASIAGGRSGLITVGTVGCLVAFAFGSRRTARRLVAVLAVTVAVLTIGMSVWYEWSSTLGSDIYHAHRLAGAAMASGENPYTDAVRFSDGNPFAPPDRVFDGYPYPPVALLTYGLAGAFTDPMLISTIAWLGFVGWLAWRAIRSRSFEISTVSLSVLMVMAMAPLGSEVWYMAWTEPLSLILFTGAAIAWNRSTTGAGLLLGLALASKQYLIFLAPLLLLHRDLGWRRRSVIAIITAVATLLIGLAPNPAAFVQATFVNLAGIEFRPDTQSLPGLAAELGLDLLLPNVVWIVLALAMTTLLARSSRTRSGFIIRSGLALGAAFLLGMAFPNYWFLVAGLLGLGAILEVEESVAVNPVELVTV